MTAHEWRGTQRVYGMEFEECGLCGALSVRKARGEGGGPGPRHLRARRQAWPPMAGAPCPDACEEAQALLVHLE